MQYNFSRHVINAATKIFPLQYNSTFFSFFFLKVEKAFHTHILAVKTSYRGLNIGKKLIERSLEKAKSSSYTHATIECSSFYSAKVVASLGFDLFHEIQYKDYIDENGRVVFQTQKPHEAIKKYVKRLQGLREHRDKRFFISKAMMFRFINRSEILQVRPD